MLYLEVYIQAMGVEAAEVNSLAAHTGQLTGCCGAEGHIMDGPWHTHTGEQLEGFAAPQGHLWIREVSYEAVGLSILVIMSRKGKYERRMQTDSNLTDLQRGRSDHP